MVIICGKGKVANSPLGQLNIILIFPCPRSRLRIWFRETGSAVPSRGSLFISILRLNLVLTHGIPPELLCTVTGDRCKSENGTVHSPVNARGTRRSDLESYGLKDLVRHFCNNGSHLTGGRLCVDLIFARDGLDIALPVHLASVLLFNSQLLILLAKLGLVK